MGEVVDLVSEVQTKYSPIYIIKDEKFDIDRISEYNLCLTFDLFSFTLGVIDTEEHRCLQLETYLFEDVSDINGFLIQLNDLFEDHHFLKVQFWNKVLVSVKNANFALVPKNFFDASQLGLYLKTTCNFNPKTDVALSYTTNSLNTTTIFSCEKELVKWINSAYNNNAQIIHYTSSFLECIQDEFTLEGQKSLFIHIDLTKFVIVLAEKDHVDYCNVFDFSTSDELLDLIHYVIHELNIDTEEIETILWFNSDGDIETVEKMKAYFSNIFLGARPYSINFSYVFDEIEEYQYFDLLSMYNCD